MSATLPTYVMPVRGIQATVHPQTGEAGVQFLDSTSSSVFLPLSADTLKRLAADINWFLLRLETARKARAS
jgi:hypothetical protein